MDMLNGIKVFVVDGDPFYSNIFSQYLYNFGLEDVTLFEHENGALVRLDEQPLVVFLDDHEDDLKSKEVIKCIKMHDPNIYVVTLTAREDMKTAVNSLKYGALDCIWKGYDEEKKLGEILKKITSNRAILESSSSSFPFGMLQFLQRQR